MELLTTDEILDELSNRYSACVFVGIRPMKTGGEGYVESYKSGSSATCLGLAVDLVDTAKGWMGVNKNGRGE